MRIKLAKYLSPVAAAVALLAGTSVSFATPLPVGGTVVPGAPLTAGNVGIADTGWLPWSYGSGDTATSGLVREVVFRESTATNPFGLVGALDFAIQVQVTGGGLDGDTHRVSTDSFRGFLTDVSQLVIGAGNLYFVPGGKAALTADRPTAGVVGFNMDTMFVGDVSNLLIVQTNALSYTAGKIHVIDGGTADISGFAPISTPEPASIVLFGTFLGMAGCRVVYRRFKGRVIA
jgi:hypothetical protein